jgi:hypothetical protein
VTQQFLHPSLLYLQDLSHDDIFGLLHLALNSSHPPAAAAGVTLLQRWPQQLDNLPADEALALLQTAVERHSTSRPPALTQTVILLEDYPDIPVVQMLPVLLRALELDARVPPAAADEEPDPYQPHLRLWQLISLPVFEQLSPDAAAGLLETAIKAGDRRSVLLLWSSMQAVQAVSPAGLSDLLQAAAAAGDAYSLRLLARLPAFHELQPAALAAAMMPAVKAGFETCVIILQESSAAAQLAAGECELLMDLLFAAVHADKPSMLPVLLELSPTRINLKRLMLLLQAALQYCPAGFMCLYQLPAAANIQAKQLGQLLRWAARWFRHGIVYEVLNWHRAWSKVSPEDKLVGLLQLALQQGASGKSFCVHPCAAAVDVELAWLLLHFAVVTEQHSNLQSLLLLPAAAKLSKEKIVELMMVAVQGAEGAACLATFSAKAAAAAAAEGSVAAGSNSISSGTEQTAQKQHKQQQYTFRAFSSKPIAAVAAAASGPGLAGSSGNAAASSGGAAATAAAAEGPFSGGAGNDSTKDSLSQPMQSLSLSSNTAAAAKAVASIACLAVLCEWDAAAEIGADGLLQLLQVATKRAIGATMTPAAGQQALSKPDFTAVHMLCDSKAAAGVSSVAELKPLLQLVLKCHDEARSVELLLERCPAAAMLDAAMLAELLQHVFSNAPSTTTSARASLQDGEVETLAWPAAVAEIYELSTEQQAALQGAAAQLAAAGAPRMHVYDLTLICTPSMEVDVGLLEDLLLQAAIRGDAAFAAALCQCRAAAQLSSDAIKLVLTAAALTASICSPDEHQKAAAAAAAAGRGGSSGAGVAGVGASAAAGTAQPLAAAGTKQGGKAGRRCKKAHRRGKE